MTQRELRITWMDLILWFELLYHDIKFIESMPTRRHWIFRFRTDPFEADLRSWLLVTNLFWSAFSTVTHELVVEINSGRNKNAPTCFMLCSNLILTRPLKARRVSVCLYYKFRCTSSRLIAQNENRDVSFFQYTSAGDGKLNWKTEK